MTFESDRQLWDEIRAEYRGRTDQLAPPPGSGRVPYCPVPGTMDKLNDLTMEMLAEFDRRRATVK